MRAVAFTPNGAGSNVATLTVLPMSVTLQIFDVD